MRIIGFVMILLIASCASDHAKEPDLNNPIDSAYFRVSGGKGDQCLLFCNLKFKHNQNFIYTDLQISYTDKYDREWFRVTPKIKDTDYNGGGWKEFVMNINCTPVLSESDLSLAHAIKYELYEGVNNIGALQLDENDRVLVPGAKWEITDVKFKE